MFESVVQRERDEQASISVDIAPLIDIVFILLIFFLTSTTFLQDRGLAVSRPQAQASERLEPHALRIVIGPRGTVFISGRAVDGDECRKEIERFASRRPHAAVILVADESISARRLVEVMDLARQAGVADIAVATRALP